MLFTTGMTVLVDLIAPVPGNVSDGDDVGHDVDYTSETATVQAAWSGFQDPESGVADYTVTVEVNGQVSKTFSGLSNSMQQFTDNSLSLHHGDSMLVRVEARNR